MREDINRDSNEPSKEEVDETENDVSTKHQTICIAERRRDENDKKSRSHE